MELTHPLPTLNTNESSKFYGSRIRTTTIQSPKKSSITEILKMWRLNFFIKYKYLQLIKKYHTVKSIILDYRDHSKNNNFPTSRHISLTDNAHSVILVN